MIHHYVNVLMIPNTKEINLFYAYLTGISHGLFEIYKLNKTQV